MVLIQLHGELIAEAQHPSLPIIARRFPQVEPHGLHGEGPAILHGNGLGEEAQITNDLAQAAARLHVRIAGAGNPVDGLHGLLDVDESPVLDHPLGHEEQARHPLKLLRRGAILPVGGGKIEQIIDGHDPAPEGLHIFRHPRQVKAAEGPAAVIFEEGFVLVHKDDLVFRKHPLRIGHAENLPEGLGL